MIKKFDAFKSNRNEAKKWPKGSKTKQDKDQRDERDSEEVNGYDSQVNRAALRGEKFKKEREIKNHKYTDKTPKGSDMKKYQAPQDEEDAGLGVKENDIEKQSKEGMGVKNEKVQLIGKIAKFPTDTQASKAYKFLENVKISKKKIWYLMVEKQNNELQMIKYNQNVGVDLKKFVESLKEFYISNVEDPKVKAIIEAIEVDGEDKFSTIKNIPRNLMLDGKNAIVKITEDLIKLLGDK